MHSKQLLFTFYISEDHFYIIISIKSFKNNTFPKIKIWAHCAVVAVREHQQEISATNNPTPTTNNTGGTVLASNITDNTEITKDKKENKDETSKKNGEQ